MSVEQRQQDQLYLVIQALVSAGQTLFRPGHIGDALRERGDPMGTWQIRVIMTALEDAGLISHDPELNQWSLSTDQDQSATASG